MLQRLAETSFDQASRVMENTPSFVRTDEVVRLVFVADPNLGGTPHMVQYDRVVWQIAGNRV